jgi:hypothetical protein
MIIYEGLAGLMLFLAMAVYAIYIYGRLCRDDGYAQGYGDALQVKHDEQAKDRAEKAGRHRMSQPRALPSPAPAAVPPEPKPGPVRLPSGGAIGVFLARNYRAARGVDTVLLAPQPSPHLTGAADTGTMTKVSITSTGDMPVLTDSFIADLELREAAYRKEHAESEA